MKSYVALLYELYCELTGSTQTTGGLLIELGQFHFCPIQPAEKDCLWVEIVPNIHNLKGKYTRSATLRFYDPIQRSIQDTVPSLVELQIMESDDPHVPTSILLFYHHGHASSFHEDAFMFTERCKRFFGEYTAPSLVK